MRRREFIALIGGTAAAWPLSAYGQQHRMPTIGVLVVETAGAEQFRRLFRQLMRELGYVEGQNVQYEFRSDQGQISRLLELAAELVRLEVDVIVTWYTPAALAAKEATRKIPIVMALAGDPVTTGLVDSLSRPGGNITGMAGVTAELSGKAVDLVRELLPSAKRVVALANAPDPFSKPFIERIRLDAATVGINVDAKALSSSDELDATFLDIEKEGADAIIVQPSLPGKRVADLAIRYRLPSISAVRAFAEEGGLMSYAAAENYLYRRAAVYVDKILKGVNPADLPVEQPSQFALIFNLTTAKALGLTILPSLLARADELIE